MSIAELGKFIKDNYSNLRSRSQASAEDLKNLFRVVSFSSAEIDPATEIVMWSHYANQHFGMRVGFDFPNMSASGYSIKKVNYDAKRILLRPEDNNDKDGANLWKAHYTKSEGWKYEQEFRLITKPEHCERLPGNAAEATEFFRHQPTLDQTNRLWRQMSNKRNA
jgi:hypothetical protein